VGQKVHPFIQRLGVTKNWQNVREDYRIRDYIRKKFQQAAISYIVIERLAEEIKVKIATARPGVLIGRRGADIDKLRSQLQKITGIENMDNIKVDPIEIKNPTVDAQLVAQNVAFQLEKRVAFRRAVKRAVDQSMQSGVKGIRICVSGRLGGAEIARRETYHEGSIPLQTFRADIDYGFAEAFTTYGVIGVKAWIYTGEVIREKGVAEQKTLKK